MSSHALAAVFNTRGLSDTQFRILAFLADCDAGDYVEASLDWMVRKVRMPADELRERLDKMRTRWPDQFQLAEQDGGQLVGLLDWDGISEAESA